VRGTNLAELYKISGSGPSSLQLPLLGVDDYVTILRGLLDEPHFVPSESATCRIGLQPTASGRGIKLMAT